MKQLKIILFQIVASAISVLSESIGEENESFTSFGSG